MKLDLEKGAYISIGGELGKYNSIPVEVLAKIAHDLQNLVLSVAQYSLSANEPVDLNNFKIELVDFKHGSAIPKFAYSKRSENKSGVKWKVHRKKVNQKFEELIVMTSTGDYSKLGKMYPKPEVRNVLIENIYSVTNDFGNSPVTFANYNEKQGKVIPLYKINKLKSAAKRDLTVNIVTAVEEAEVSNDAFGKIKLVKKGNKLRKKVINYYSGKEISLEFAPEVIATDDRTYHLRYPLRCLFEKEKDYFVIQHEFLGIIGTGETKGEAERSFSLEFDYLFRRYNSLQDDQLSRHLQLAKAMFNQYGEKIEE